MSVVLYRFVRPSKDASWSTKSKVAAVAAIALVVSGIAMTILGAQGHFGADHGGALIASGACSMALGLLRGVKVVRSSRDEDQYQEWEKNGREVPEREKYYRDLGFEDEEIIQQLIPQDMRIDGKVLQVSHNFQTHFFSPSGQHLLEKGWKIFSQDT